MPFSAVKLIGYVPPVPAAGVPDSTPVDGLRVTPKGSVPVSVTSGVGFPVAVTVKLPAVPAVKTALPVLVMFGGMRGGNLYATTRDDSRTAVLVVPVAV